MTVPDTTMTDPLGRSITLFQSGRSIHIAPRHPEIAPHRALVESAISNPIIITVSHHDNAVRLYHGPGPRPNVMIRVAADVVRGFVKTAHLVRKVSATESIEWSSQAR